MVKTTVQGISVVLPCLNEEASIGQVIELARAGIKKLGLEEDIIVVNNASTDRSAEVAAKHGARVIDEPQRGYGSALRRGFRNARYEIMVMGDADLSYDLSDLDRLVQPLLDGSADFVMGNRMRNIQPGAMPWLHRYIGNPLLSGILRVLFRSNAVHDAHCGMRAITREAYERLQCVTTGMEFASEMVVRALRCPLRIAERDIILRPRLGESKLSSFRDGWRHLRFMVLHSPTLLLLIPGLIGWLLGLLVSLPLAFGPLHFQGRLIDIHCMLVGGVLNLISLQLLAMGILGKAYAHLSGLQRDPIVARLYRWFTFEKASIASGIVILSGLLLTGWVVTKWVASGFGALDQQRMLFLALLCLVNGVQLGATSFLLSIMALPRRLDHLPPDIQSTGITDT